MRRIAIAMLTAGLLILPACGDDTEPGATDQSPAPTSPPVDTAAPTEPAAPTGTEPADSGTTGPDQTQSWSTSNVTVPFTGSVPPVPLLVDLRIGSHPAEGYDRVALEFEGLPGYEVGYRDEIVYDGSGEPVELPGEAFIQLVFSPAQAHDDGGTPSLTPVPTEPVDVGFDTLQAYVLNGDFEGYVSVALGLTETVGFRVDHFTSSNGNDVVYIDVARP